MIHASQLHGGSSDKAQEYLEGWQRSRAEFDNLRKRMHTEYDEQRLTAQAQLARMLLDVADSFGAVTRHVPKKLQEDSWVQGVMHVARQFDQLLTTLGMTRIVAEGNQFDPALHEAVDKVKTKDVPSGEVVEVLQSGYRIGNRTVRPARVKIAE